MSNVTLIEHLLGRPVFDARGRPAIEAEVVLSGGARGRAIAPAGDAAEALVFPDGDEIGVDRLADGPAAIRGSIEPALLRMDATDQALIDQRLIELAGAAGPSFPAASATIAVSMAIAHAAAAAACQPLYRYLAGDRPIILPLPEIQILPGAAGPNGRLDIRALTVLCTGAATLTQALEWTASIARAARRLVAEGSSIAGDGGGDGGCQLRFASDEQALELLVRAIERAGRRPGDDVQIGLDMAGAGTARDGRPPDTDHGSQAMSQRLLTWLRRYPIASLVDPLGGHDIAGLCALTAKAGERVHVVGDALLATDSDRVHKLAALGAVNALLARPGRRATLSEIKAAIDAARIAGFATIVAAGPGGSEDRTIAHLALGWGAGRLRADDFDGSGPANWNELLRIEEALGAAGRFAGRRAVPRGLQRPD